MTTITIKRVDHFTTAAKHLLGITSPTWHYKSIERVDKTCQRDLGFIVVGSETTPYTKGPRKGCAKWIGEESRVVVTRKDLDDQLGRFEATTGDCYECYGEGKYPWSVSTTDGTQYKPCKRCGATGKAP